MIELISRFNLFLARQHTLDMKEISQDLDRCKMFMKDHNLDEDDIPF